MLGVVYSLYEFMGSLIKTGNYDHCRELGSCPLLKTGRTTERLEKIYYDNKLLINVI